MVGATGNIGGISSHEYHFPAPIGEDTLQICSNCHNGINCEVKTSDEVKCPLCQSPIQETKGIEVGHTFLLGTKYAKTLKAKFLNRNGSRLECEMGCYGLGVSRILAASVELLSENSEIRWPKSIAPFMCCVIAPKVRLE